MNKPYRILAVGDNEGPDGHRAITRCECAKRRCRFALASGRVMGTSTCSHRSSAPIVDCN